MCDIQPSVRRCEPVLYVLFVLYVAFFPHTPPNVQQNASNGNVDALTSSSTAKPLLLVLATQFRPPSPRQALAAILSRSAHRDCLTSSSLRLLQVR